MHASIPVILCSLALVGCAASGASELDPATLFDGAGKADGDGDVAALDYGETRRSVLAEDPRFFSFRGEAGDVVSVFATAEDRRGGARPALVLTTEDRAERGAPPVAMVGVVEDTGRADAHLIDVALPEDDDYLLALVNTTSARDERVRVRLSCTGGRCAPTPYTRRTDDCRLSAQGLEVQRTLHAEVNPDRAPFPVADATTFRNQLSAVLLSRAPQLHGLGDTPLPEGTTPPYAPETYERPAIFPALADLIATARYEVDIRSANIKPSDGYDDIMLGIARLESRLRAEGRHGDPALVRIIADSFEVGGARDRVYAERLWTSVHALALDPQLVEVQIAAHHHFSVGEDHSKIIVIDGAHVHIGGANPHDNNPYDHPEHDAAFVFTGEVAQAALADFDYSWNRGNTELWRCERFDEDGRARDCDDGPTPPPTHRPEVADPDWDALGLPGDACVPMIYLGKRGSASLFTNRIDHPIGQGIVATLRSARGLIRLESPNLNDDAILEELVAALMRDPTVRVQIVVPPKRNESKTRLPGGGGTNESKRARLLGMITEAVMDLCDGETTCEAQRIKEPEIVGRIQYRWFPIEGDVPGAQHVKYFSVDGQLVIVGSANADTQSMNRARESSILVDDAWVTSHLDEMVFVPDFEISRIDPILDDGIVRPNATNER